MGDGLLVCCGFGLTFAVVGVAVAVAGFVGRDEIDSTRLDPFLTMAGGS